MTHHGDLNRGVVTEKSVSDPGKGDRRAPKFRSLRGLVCELVFGTDSPVPDCVRNG